MAEKETAGKANNEGRGVCLFSGQPTGSKRSRFLPGNDAKLKSTLLKVHRGELKLEGNVRKAAIEQLRSETGLVGFKLDKNNKLEVVGNFKVAEAKAKVEKKATAPAPAKAAKTAKAKPVVVESVDEEEE